VRAERGMVAVHSAATSVVGAPAGQTILSLECPDAETLAETLTDAGYDGVTIVDESYGRVVSVLDPDGAQLLIDEVMSDTYGYHDRSAERQPLPGTRVSVWRPSADPSAMERFIAMFGIGIEDVRVTVADPRVAVPMLQGGDGTRRPAATAALRISTIEALGTVADRLTGHGHAVDLQVHELRVIDPDHQPLVISGPP
jgi:hypothetical protein